MYTKLQEMVLRLAALREDGERWRRLYSEVADHAATRAEAERERHAILKEIHSGRAEFKAVALQCQQEVEWLETRPQHRGPMIPDDPTSESFEMLTSIALQATHRRLKASEPGATVAGVRA